MDKLHSAMQDLYEMHRREWNMACARVATLALDNFQAAMTTLSSDNKSTTARYDNSVAFRRLQELNKNDEFALSGEVHLYYTVMRNSWYPSMP